MQDCPPDPAKARRADTIVAISSPPGRSPRGLVRLSGPEAFVVVERFVRATGSDQTLSPAACGRSPEPAAASGRAKKNGARLNARMFTRGGVLPPLPPLPVLVTRFNAPHSYTGEDSAELQLPGNPALLDRVVRQAVAHGARLAEPGEFTFRAYLAGKLDLTEAEGIAATISAVSDAQLAAASHLREGALGRFAADHVEELGRLLALVEAGIDFTDQEDVVPITPRALAAALDDVQASLRALLDKSRSWGSVEALPRVVLVGPPSAGKSTLFNALLGRPRAVVDAMPGTTRDVLEEPMLLVAAEVNPSAGVTADPADGLTSAAPVVASGGASGGEVLLVDIAGLDDAAAALDRDVQAAADRAIERADLVLVLGAVSRPLPGGVATLQVQTRCDIELRDPAADVSVSGVTGTGLDVLRRLIVERLGDRVASRSAESLALQPRHEAGLRDALAALAAAHGTVDPDAPALGLPELVAAPLREALDHLAALGGQMTPDDVIGKVFASFCIGK